MNRLLSIVILAVTFAALIFLPAQAQQGTLTPTYLSPTVTYTSLPFTAATVGNYPVNLYATNSTAGRFVVTGCSIEIVSITGSSTQATVSIGITGSAYTDIAGTTLIPTSTAGTVSVLTIAAPQTPLPINSLMYCRVSIATLSTTEILLAHVTGYYEK